MRVYLRLGRGIGVSFPWWLTPIVGLLWLAGFLVVALVCAVVVLVQLGVGAVRRLGRRRRSSHRSSQENRALP